MYKWLSSFRMHLSAQGNVSSSMISLLGSHWVDYNAWSEKCLDDVWELQFLVQVYFWESSCLLDVGYPASLCCWLAALWCLLWRMGLRWCLCFPWDVLFCSRSNMWASYLNIKLWRHPSSSLTKGHIARRQYVIQGTSFITNTTVQVVCQVP